MFLRGERKTKQKEEERIEREPEDDRVRCGNENNYRCGRSTSRPNLLQRERK